MKARRTSVDVKGRLKDQRSKLKDVTSAAEEAEEAQAALRTEVHRLRTERDALKTAQAHGKEAAAQLKSVRAERDRLAAAIEQSKGRTASTAAQPSRRRRSMERPSRASSLCDVMKTLGRSPRDALIGLTPSTRECNLYCYYL